MITSDPWIDFAFGHREWQVGDGTCYHVHPVRAVAEPALVAKAPPGTPHDERGMSYFAKYHPNPADPYEYVGIGYFASEAAAKQACREHQGSL